MVGLLARPVRNWRILVFVAIHRPGEKAILEAIHAIHWRCLVYYAIQLADEKKLAEKKKLL